ncbi:DUF975 family protein [Pediococcus cellicola]|uniref:Integral membrane protein n=1 Tax=Pediococcus cellicola TaxID=319652 RepID=A0A0R2IT92_9LACO|nr:DUF975 family protein [Pediococcus cellicola]KRN65159.1 hypothetical protein IV80_GL000516 [Pediococcus cellicola]GEL15794.1 membrane protein [Pediococcus cellicola]
MSNHRVRKNLKKEVKTTFKGHWGQATQTAIVPVVVRAISGFMISLLILISLYVLFKNPSLITGNDVTNYASEESASTGSTSVWNFLRAALLTFIGAGISFTYLDWLRNPNLQFSPIKSGFQAFTKRYFIPTLAIFIWQFIFLFLWTLLFIIPGFIKYFAYSQSYLIYKDQLRAGNADKIEYIDCLTMSRQLMDGHKFEFLMLKLSMLGWLILCLFSFGIGFIWYVPYSQAVYTAFYKHLVEIQ